MELKKKWLNFIHRLDERKIGGTSLYNIFIKAVLFLTFLIVIPLLFSTDKSFKYTDMKIGSIAAKKVVAPYNFFVLKTDEELKSERAKAVAQVPFYFVYNDSITDKQIYKLSEALPDLMKNKPAFSPGDSSEIKYNNRLSSLKYEFKILFDIDLTVVNLKIIYDILNEKTQINNFNAVLTECKRYIKKGILSLNLNSITRPNVTVIKNSVEEVIADDERIDLPGLQKIIEDKLLEHFDASQAAILKYFLNQIIEPNLIYEKVFTENAVDEAVASVSLTKDMVYENERIVDANERINETIYQKLYSLEISRVEHSRQEGNWQNKIAFLCKMMLLASILLIVGLYLYSFRKKIFADNKMLLLIGIILLGQIIFASIITGPLNWSVYLIPTTISSMLLAILIDSGIAFVGTVAIALILGGIQGGGYDIVLLTLVSGMVGIFSVHRIRTRNHVFKAIAYITLAYLWVIIALTGLRYDQFMEVFKTFGVNLLPNAVLSPFITFMVLGIFEKLFDITTDVKLLELSDMNHPLLKNLSLEAPGTFHHSMIVGNLSEAAAKEIGGNSLLARVGSYYHDIGKMEKPEYFVENQMDAENRHNMLAPSMSALILASHVKNGIELAKKHGIPKLILNFIPEHHGTNTMVYFYNKAVEMADGNDVNEADFRYPGPKPQSKETGIVMIADAVEAASRTLTNPTPNKLRSFVENMVYKRFEEGQLDECDLTLRDLKKIVDAFVLVLYGVFQHRIEYPEAAKGDKKKTAPKQRKKAEKVNKNENSNSSTES
jgi:putative nucleotidyltransferase with HDIG domain